MSGTSKILPILKHKEREKCASQRKDLYKDR